MLTEHLFSTLFSACVSSFSVCSLSEHSFFLSVCLICTDTAVRLAQDASKRVPSVIRMFHGVSCCLVCSGLHARYTDTFNGSDQFPFRHEQCELVRVRVEVVLRLLLWTRQDRERFYVSSATMVIKISRVHSPVVKVEISRSLVQFRVEVMYRLRDVVR